MAAVALMRVESRWRVTTANGEIAAEAVIVAVPAHAASPLLSGVDPAVSELCAGVRYVSSASVALAWRRDDIHHPLAGSGFVVARRYNRLRATACTWVSSKWAARAPEGMALLRVFIGGAHDPAAVDLGDDEMVELAVRDMTPVLDIRGAPVLTRVHRWRNAGAQHNVGQLARMAAIERALQALPGLFVAGSGFRSIGIPDCVADGQAAAAAAATYVRIGST
jgi:oxygen-dependent protoporphyrinogen oxidase